jgi:hypothetical protein
MNNHYSTRENKDQSRIAVSGLIVSLDPYVVAAHALSTYVGFKINQQGGIFVKVKYFVG